jgi:hypothetical protein
VMYSWYVLNGNGWNKTEKEIRKAIQNAGMTTRLSYKEVRDQDGVLGFESSVSCASFLLRRRCQGGFRQEEDVLTYH